MVRNDIGGAHSSRITRVVHRRTEPQPGARKLLADPRWSRWLESLKSAATREGYARDATQWAAWLSGRGVRLYEATDADLTSWVSGLDDRAAPATVNRKAAAVVSFYRWAAKTGLVPAPLSAENRPKVHVDPVRKLGKPADEVRALIRAAEPGLERALITLLAHTGARVSEATGADVTDVRTIQGRRVLQVTGKGRKQRTPPLTDEAWPVIRDYIGDRRSGPLFITPGPEEGVWQPLDRHEAWRIVRRVGDRAGFANMHPHLFRHSAAVLMIRAGYSLKQVAVALGHADIKTTAGYLEGLAALEDSPAYGLSQLLAEDDEEDIP